MMGEYQKRADIRILCIGAAVQDVYLQGKIFKPHKEEDGDLVEEFQLGSKNDIEGVTFSTGGGATNGAVTFARQGLHSIFMGKIGRDIAGKAVLDDLHHNGVDTSLVEYLDDIGTGYSCVLLAPNGERTYMTYRGASAHLDFKESDFHDIRVDWLFLTSLAGNYEALDRVVSYAKRHSIKIAIVPGKDELKEEHKLQSYISQAEVLICNKDELSMLYGEGSPVDLVVKANRDIHYVACTDGPNGAVVADRQRLIKAGMYQDVPVVDRGGAGDAFASGFVAMIAAGETLEQAVTFASANSTSVVTKIGAKAGILSAEAAIHNMPLNIREMLNV
jgi:ribokinase